MVVSLYSTGLLITSLFADVCSLTKDQLRTVLTSLIEPIMEQQPKDIEAGSSSCGQHQGFSNVTAIKQLLNLAIQKCKYYFHISILLGILSIYQYILSTRVSILISQH